MSYLAELRWSVLACATIAGLARTAIQAEEPAKPVEKPAHTVLVTPGSILRKQSGPIEPKSFEVAMGRLNTGDEVTFEMEIRNTSDGAIKILGGNEGCSRQGCIKLAGKYPCLIPPHETGRVKAIYKALPPPWDRDKKERQIDLEAEFYVSGVKTYTVPYRITATLQSVK